MPGESKRLNGQPAPELSEALVADTVAVVMHLVREQQAPEAIVSPQAAWLLHKVLVSLEHKETKHDTLLRIPEIRFAAWAKRVRAAMRGRTRAEKQ
jgi:hypothetical protein